MKMADEKTKPVKAEKKEEDEPYILSTSPHVRNPETVRSIMWDVVLALIPAAAAGVYFFGADALLVILTCIVACVATEAALQTWFGKPVTVNDGSAVLTGLLLALTLSAGVPLWMAAIGGAFAIVVAKYAFGGLGYNIFNPALTGRAFLMASWPVLMAARMPLGAADAVTRATPLALLKVFTKIPAVDATTGATPLTGTAFPSLLDMFWGNIGGMLGETSAAALLLGAAYLFYKGIIDWRIPFTYVGSVFVLMLVLTQDLMFTEFHVLTGGLILGAFFMATDYVSSPITKRGRIVFGVGCGLLTAVIRQFGGLPEGVMYSILIMNGFTPLIDRLTAPEPFGAVPKEAGD
jgi:electron transport complex protein RnfD